MVVVVAVVKEYKDYFENWLLYEFIQFNLSGTNTVDNEEMRSFYIGVAPERPISSIVDLM